MATYYPDIVEQGIIYKHKEEGYQKSMEADFYMFKLLRFSIVYCHPEKKNTFRKSTHPGYVACLVNDFYFPCFCCV